MDLLGEIVAGGAEKAREAGVVIAGGHTIQDKEPKFGLVVVGFVDPQRILTKAGLQPGDHLVLTKPLGFGVTTTALKRELAAEEDVAEVVRWMKQLNAQAARLAQEFHLCGVTDVTGFSLLGHAYEMAEASRVRLRFSFNQIPFVSGARRYADLWTFPGGAADNRLYYEPQVSFAVHLSETDRMLLFDPQTSGGLLMGVPASRLEAFLAAAESLEQSIWVIGDVTDGEGIVVE